MAKKLYVHFEEQEPNFTSPFPLEAAVTFSELTDSFCNKYNAKHGAKRQLISAGVQCKVGRCSLHSLFGCTKSYAFFICSKIVSPENLVVDHVNAGEDVFIVVNKDYVPTGEHVVDHIVMKLSLNRLMSCVVDYFLSDIGGRRESGLIFANCTARSSGKEIEGLRALRNRS